MVNDCQAHATKRAVNVTLDSALVDEARALGIPLPATLGAALLATVVAERARRWQEENREAIEAYNARIERDGMFGDDVSGLQPALTVDGTPLVMETLAIVGVPTREGELSVEMQSIVFDGGPTIEHLETRVFVEPYNSL